jgi:hypothetical protein
MAVLCLPTNTPWPWPTPAGAASARGGFSTLGTGAVAEWRGRSAAEVCTSEARKIRVPLARARDGVPQQAWFPRICAERMNVCPRGGRCGKERPAEEGAGRRQLHRRLEAGRRLPPFKPKPCVASRSLEFRCFPRLHNQAHLRFSGEIQCSPMRNVGRE